MSYKQQKNAHFNKVMLKCAPSKFMFHILIPAMTVSLVNKQIHFKRQRFHKGFSNLIRDLKGPLPHFVMSAHVNSSQPKWALTI